MRTLSSGSTVFTKFVLPGGFIAVWPVWLLQVNDPRFGYLPCVLWALVSVFLVWWTAPIKKVALSGDRFVISNFRREISVPTTQLRRVYEDRWNRTPNVVLHFDPPTEFGPKVRIVVSWDFGKKELNRVASELRAIAAKNA